MYLLHLETSTSICSVAISNGPDLIEYIDLEEGMQHTALLVPTIDKLLKSCELLPADLAGVSVSAGPGSYTGLRVGGSTAKAMAYSLKIPILSVPTLLSLAEAALDRYPEAEFAFPMIDARRNEVYTALFDRQLNEVIPTSSLIIEDQRVREVIPTGKRIVACGDGAHKLAVLNKEHIIIDTGLVCSARYLVAPAFRMVTEGKKSDPMHFVPFYLKPPNITTQKNPF